MQTMMDIYYSIDMRIVSLGYWDLDDEGKKMIVDFALKEYLANHVSKNGSKEPFEVLMTKSIEELISILDCQIPDSQKFDTLRHIIHYILNISGTMQGFSIIWEVSQEEKHIKNPEALFNNEGKWDTFVSHKETSYLDAFKVAYQTYEQSIALKK